MTNQRPKLSISLDSIDILLEFIGWTAVLAGIGVSFYYYNNLPDRIPTHFNIQGDIDGYSGKGMLFVMPTVSIIVYYGLFVLHRFPHLHNYNSPITEQNAEGFYTISTKFLRLANVITALLMFYIECQIILSAMNGKSTFSIWSIVIYTFVLLVAMIWMFYKNSRLRKISYS